MKITIFTGGTGSIALQRGLYHSLESNTDGVDIKIVVNAYDNGLSTGAVRRVMDGEILGPSDVRKNQTTRLRFSDPDSPWHKFLDVRFTTESSRAHEYCTTEALDLLRRLEAAGRNGSMDAVLLGAIDEYFKRPAAAQIGYESFSLANVVYAGLAAANGNSLRAAARIMSNALGIPDHVILNDDTSLFLGALTRSGKRITDEGEIVAWGNQTDPFVDVFFVDSKGASATPRLCLEAWRAIVEADLIILSSGTQWSSLIPTYASRGFKEAIRDSNAKILMVMNRAPDKDCPGLTASDIVNVLVPRYFDEGRVHVLADRNGHENMRQLSSAALAKVASFTQTELSSAASAADKHDPARLADAIGYVYFREHVDSTFFLFDYDDTLRARNNKFPKSASFNINGLRQLNELTHVGVCTGNTIRALDFRVDSATHNEDIPLGKPLLVFADGGANEYTCSFQPADAGRAGLHRFARCVSPQTMLPASGPHSAREIIDALIRAGIPASKIDNRGGAVIAIKPVAREDRRAVISLARSLILGSDLEVREAGTTTIEIRHPRLTKVDALRLLRTERKPSTITYVGDECESGNDHDIAKLSLADAGLRCLRVNHPAITAFFIATLLSHLRKHGNR
jgi:2-phospho-L-lactate transferase/gluconeogenesis factor (CofD/UPF0052 family)